MVLSHTLRNGSHRFDTTALITISYINLYILIHISYVRMHGVMGDP